MMTQLTLPLWITQKASLQGLNSFGIPCQAQYLATITNTSQWFELFQLPFSQTLPVHYIGEGSNILLTHDIPGLMIHNQLKGISVIDETTEHVTLKVAGGENWHDLVTYCLQKGYSGLENLSLIPGTVGAAPVQNIGAYGIELKDYLLNVDVIDRTTQQSLTLTNAACKFSYRNSLFKQQLDRYWITHITLKLSKQPRYHIDYPSLKDVIEQSKQPLSPELIYHSVIALRQSKLPDPKVIGNAGSFFKNPIISTQKYLSLKQHYPHIPGFPLSNTHYKVPAAWLIEQSKLKGITEGNVGTYPQQAVVLINHGACTGNEMLIFSEKIKTWVNQQFNISLEPEVRMIPALS